MADDKIALSIEIEADRAQMSLGELEEGFDGLREKLKATNRGTEEGRAEFKKLSTQMAQTSGEIKNLELGFEGLDQEQIASEFGGLAGGIGDVTASLVLMGGENETIEQMGASIEKAMAISMGVKGVMEGAAAANKLYTNSVRAKAVVEKVAAAGTWILNTANKALNTTLKMNPIGLIIIALTAVVGAIVYFKDAIMNVMEVALKPFQFLIDIVIDGLQAMGIMATDEAIAQEEAAKKVVEAAKKRNEAAAEQRKVHKELTESMVADIDFEIRKRTIAGKDFAELSRKKIELLQEVAVEEAKAAENNRIALEATMKAMGSFGKHYDEIYEGAVDTAKDAADEARKLAEDLAAHDLEQEQKRSDARKKVREEDNKKLIEDTKALAEFEEEQARIRIQLIQDEGERKRAEIEYNSQLELEALEKKGQLTFDAEMLIAQTKNKALADLEKVEDDKRFALEKEAQDKRDEYDKLLFDTKVANEQEETERQRLQIEEDFQKNLATLEEQGLLTMGLEIELLMAREKALADIELEAKQKLRDKNFALASAAIGALSALNKAATDTALLNAAGDEEKKEKIRKASFEREKKLNIAMALINGAQAVLAGFAQGGLPMAIVAGVTAAAQLAAIVATTYQGGGSVKEVSDSTVPSPDGAGAGGAGAQINPVTNTSTILGNQQVTVTETDITNTQNNVSVIEESATF